MIWGPLLTFIFRNHDSWHTCSVNWGLSANQAIWIFQDKKISIQLLRPSIVFHLENSDTFHEKVNKFCSKVKSWDLVFLQYFLAYNWSLYKNFPKKKNEAIFSHIRWALVRSFASKTIKPFTLFCRKKSEKDKNLSIFLVKK